MGSRRNNQKKIMNKTKKRRLSKANIGTLMKISELPALKGALIMRGNIVVKGGSAGVMSKTLKKAVRFADNVLDSVKTNGGADVDPLEKINVKTDSVSEPLSESQSTTKTTGEPISEPVDESVTELKAEPTPESLDESVTELKTEPTAESTTEVEAEEKMTEPFNPTELSPGEILVEVPCGVSEWGNKLYKKINTLGSAGGSSRKKSSHGKKSKTSHRRRKQSRKRLG